MKKKTDSELRAGSFVTALAVIAVLMTAAYLLAVLLPGCTLRCGSGFYLRCWC